MPVIIVGNIFVGGTGKTPFTIWLSNAMRKVGFFPGVISRGYGSTAYTRTIIVTTTSLVKEVGDEPLLIAKNTKCPVVIGHDRVAAAKLLLAHNPKVNLIISDDGLQHYALNRDIEIIIFDKRGHGNGWLLPAGPLREPTSRNCDFKVQNLDCTYAQNIPTNTIVMRLISTHIRQLCNNQNVKLLSKILSTAKITAVAGIGNPERFFTSLQIAGLFFRTLVLPDHYNYDTNPFATLKTDLILITEKDAIKCQTINGIMQDTRIWIVPVSASINHKIIDQIVKKLHESKTIQNTCMSSM